MRAHGLVRAGAMRTLAEFVARERPQILAVCEIEPGDALSLATRFALQWAYRGRAALFWSGPFSAARVTGTYLPAPGRIFDRPGFVRVDGRLYGKPCTIAAAQFDAERHAAVPEVRFARTNLRQAAPHAILFALEEYRRIGFLDLGFVEAAPDGGEQHVYVREVRGEILRVARATI